MKKIILGLIVLMAMMGTAAAADDSYVVGTVYESDGTTVVPQAIVTAYTDSGYTISDGTDIANDEGRYSIDLSTLNAGDTVFVEAIKGSSVGRNSGVLNDYSNLVDFDLAIVDIEIPEFPTIALPVAAILGLAFIIQRRREEE